MEDKEARGSDGRMLKRVGEGKSKVITSAISFILSAVSKSSFHSDDDRSYLNGVFNKMLWFHIFSKCLFL